MSSLTTEILGTSDADLSRAADLLKAGQLVSFPTETVYGLGADARNGTAVASVYAAKGRPSFNPLIAHVHSVAAAQQLVQWNDLAERLAAAFWPGPLTLVLPLREDHGVSGLVTAGLQTLAVRVPAHPTALRLLRLVDGPVAAPSANPSGRISPTTAAHVLAGLNGRIAAVVDDGPCGVGVESTIVGLSGPDPMLLRPGGLAAEDIEATLGTSLTDRDAADPLSAPGQLLSHYAPNARVRLNATEAGEGELLLGFGSMDCDLNLSAVGDLAEAAANLFEHLHRLDAIGQPIAVAPIPEHGLGSAINDRLRRAAAPRDDSSAH
ncbi:MULTISPECIES: L-threonylcarbamoyladenylate synthase [Rhodobacterales]|jgi:L-threonylcarbamoyladenylate synthase|uniref:Threonylcarbamoyl-AMP synthase n=1 Tax=Phaeobacter gallaeciensis TaxID=60890 RepID=A0A1B0ZU00_9RHOB|nr:MULTISPECIES: L-threonylcarbamoyladenylate synthase [Phaeobacter]MDF1772367.1 L-threonylcarbamoyladenylate synthase [Pseudophaeobacter sp. bin_em_oilr2.035]MEE2634902.1 L-threonylcarbamoyladenylate synthase [Pseudomonadota bacterium]ANP37677.1 translation factor Sua5 [Phaeobacter gallaeciensis]MDE4060011.1 L-threonylcarbamoyladenylate synthase [Phaeobacter gallaeciensis]MDE4096830.1 L-threonylcarbamoyladenylate synthase [Phaeobacter gallaeciensis]